MDSWDQQITFMTQQRKITKQDLIALWEDDQARYEADEWYKKVGIDPFYAYCWFVTDFGNSRFFEDFPDIFHAFLSKEAQNLRIYNDISYFKYPRGCVPLEDEIYCQCKNLMFGAYKHGSVFAKKYWKNILAEYFPVQNHFLNQLRKTGLHFQDIIRYISKNTPIDDAVDEYDNNLKIVQDSCSFVVMAEILDIAVSDDCDVVYSVSKKIMKEKIDGGKKAFPTRNIDNEKGAEARDYAKEYLRKKIEHYPAPDSWLSVRKIGYSYLRYSQKIEAEVLNVNGFADDWVHANLNVFELSPQGTLESVIAIARYYWPDKEFTYEEFQIMASLMDAVNSHCHSAHCVFRMVDTILSFMPQMVQEDETLQRCSTFNERIVPQMNANEFVVAPIQKVEEKPVAKQTEEDAEKKETSLQRQIEELQLEKHKLETAYEYLKTLYSQKNSVKGELDSLNLKYEEEHQELIGLRNHLYQMTECDFDEEKYDIDKIANTLRKYNIIIIGGHSNWVAKMKELFPKWKYVDIKASAASDTKIIDNCDKVYFFTDCLSHTTYYKYIGALRKRLIPFGYIHSVNINSSLIQIAIEMNIVK